MNTRRFSIRTLLLGNTTVILVISGILFLFSDFLGVFELKTVDGRFHFRNILNKNPVFSSEIIHINIDNLSRQSSGLDIWPKRYYADLISNLSSGDPEVIVQDIMFVRSLDTLGNQALADAVVKAGNIISPYLLQFHEAETALSLEERELINDVFGFDLNPTVETGNIPSAKDYHYVPLLDLAEQSAGLGFVNIEPDMDGIIRRIPIVAEFNGSLAPSFFFQALCSYLDYELENIEVVNASRLILHHFPDKEKGTKRDLTIPLDGDGNILVNYAGLRTLENYPNSYGAWEVLQLDSPPGGLKGKLVILSDVSSVSKDLSPIPIDHMFPRSYIISNAINTVLAGEFIREMSHIFLPFIVVILSLFLILVCVKMGILRFGIISIGLIGFYVCTAFALFLFIGLIIPVFPVIIPLAGVYFFSSVYKYANTEREKGILEGSLQSYLPPSLMEKVRTNPDELLKVGGERKRISVLFADVVDFTHFCDEADPEEVQDVLERYFKEMAAIIFSVHGTIDKYIGDAILAFFENQGDEVTSASTAVRCAISMQQKARELDEIYKAQNRFPFAIRIGISTGYAKVGNIGPVEKFDYTIIGSVVNLANRLQTLGTAGDVIIEKETLFFVKDDHDIENMGERDLKGFTDPVGVHRIKI